MEILNVYKVADVPVLAFFFVGLFFVATCVLILIGVLSILNGEDAKTCCCLLFAIACFVLACFFRVYFEEAYTKERYEVKIDDTVSAIELTEDWDIIDVRGSIFVLERKEVDGE